MDLLLEHAGIRCSNGLNAFCGAANCSILIYVRTSNGTLRKVTEALGIEAKIGSGNRPKVTITGTRSVGTYTLRWSGRKFD